MTMPILTISNERENQLMREPSPVRVLSAEEVAALAGLYSPPSKKAKVVVPFPARRPPMDRWKVRK